MPTLYRNGRVWPGDATGLSSLLVDEGRIGWIGPAADAPSPAGATVVDLTGAVVTPAFVDAHVHATGTGLALTGAELSGATSLEAALAIVERAARAARGRPVLGGGWDETTWPERRAPTSAELDRASYGGAVYLARVDAHSAVVSSSLLAAAPHVRALPGFDPSGWLRREAHDAARTAAYTALSPGQTRELQRAALGRAAALGIACVHEMAGPAISSAADLAALLELAAAEPLPEVIGYWGELGAVDTARELGAAGAAGDLFCDGSLGSHTAALRAPYSDRPQTTGMLRFEVAELAEHVAACERAGLQAGFHVIGDAAVDRVLDGFEAAAGLLGRPVGPGHRLEHVEFVHDPARLAALGLTASMQPMFDRLWGGPDGMYAERLGPDRGRRLNRFADLAAAGVLLAFGSDAPVTALGPWDAVWAATAPHDREAGVPVEAAFAAHTRGGWAAARRPGGTLEAGAPATFAVWDALPAPGRTPRCLATVRAGAPIHDELSGLR